MKVGDLVRYTGLVPVGIAHRHGYVIKEHASGKNAVGQLTPEMVTVRFFDGRRPEINSYLKSDLEVISVACR